MGAEPHWYPLDGGWAPVWAESFEDGDTSPFGGGSIGLPDSYGAEFPVALPAGSQETIPFTLNSGPGYLDLTDPGNPVVIASGIYAIMLYLDISAGVDPATISQPMTGNLFIASDPPVSLNFSGAFGPTADNASDGNLTVSATLYIEAGTALQLVVENSSIADGTVDLEASMPTCFVQPIVLGEAS